MFDFRNDVKTDNKKFILNFRIDFNNSLNYQKLSLDSYSNYRAGIDKCGREPEGEKEKGGKEGRKLVSSYGTTFLITELLSQDCELKSIRPALRGNHRVLYPPPIAVPFSA